MKSHILFPAILLSFADGQLIVDTGYVTDSLPTSASQVRPWGEEPQNTVHQDFWLKDQGLCAKPRLWKHLGASRTGVVVKCWRAILGAGHELGIYMGEEGGRYDY